MNKLQLSSIALVIGAAMFTVPPVFAADSMPADSSAPAATANQSCADKDSKAIGKDNMPITDMTACKEAGGTMMDNASIKGCMDATGKPMIKDDEKACTDAGGHMMNMGDASATNNGSADTTTSTETAPSDNKY